MRHICQFADENEVNMESSDNYNEKLELELTSEESGSQETGEEDLSLDESENIIEEEEEEKSENELNEQNQDQNQNKEIDNNEASNEEDNSKEEINDGEEFDMNRKIGENHNYICKLIRKDLIEDFITYSKKNELNLQSCIPFSIFETNSFLIDQEPTLIEYAAFFGSIQIFKYLKFKRLQYKPIIMDLFNSWR